MRSLHQALQEHELIVLRVIGEWWELDLTGSNKSKAIHELTQAARFLDLAEELLYLPQEEQDALQGLVNAGGRMPFAAFSRTYGEIREMGPGALEREEPWFTPVSSAEDLWYRGLIYRGFDQAAGGDMTEFIFLPTEFFERLGGIASDADPSEDDPIPNSPIPTPVKPAAAPPPKTGLSRMASDPTLSGDSVHAPIQTIDDATSLLILAQNGQVFRDTQKQGTLPQYMADASPARIQFIVQLLEECGLLKESTDSQLRPTRAAVDWLQSNLEEALAVMVDSWERSDWNALRHVPTLICEGAHWYNDPIPVRETIKRSLPPSADWYPNAGLVDLIFNQQPDFQRPNGNYDTWYIRDAATGAYLRGFENWHQVEGRLIPFVITHPMRWLGLAQSAEDGFRLTPRGLAWLNGEPAPLEPDRTDSVIRLSAEGTLTFEAGQNRYQRFQAGRIAVLLPLSTPATSDREYTYRLTPSTLSNAQSQGITHDRVVSFLKEATQAELPTSLKRALERWHSNGIEARLESILILRVADADILNKLRDHPKTRPFIGESFGDLAAAVTSSDWEPLFQAAAQLGLFLNPPN